MRNWFILIMALTAISAVFVIALFVGCAERAEIAELTAGTTSTTSGGIAVDPIVDETTTTSTTTSTTTTTLYSAQGVLDTSFSGDGIYTYDRFVINSASKCLIDPAGKIYVSGTISDTTGIADYDSAVWSLNADGSENNLFAADGVYLPSIFDTYDVGRSIALDMSGNLVLVGTYFDSDSYNSFLIRFNGAGLRDEGFGITGLVTLGAGGNDGAEDVFVDSLGKIIVGGYYNNKLALFRFLADGQALDPTFSGDGIATYESTSTAWARRIVVDDEGSVFVAGQLRLANYDIVVAKFDNVGILDADFGDAGAFIYDQASGNDYGWGIALDDDSRILYCGYVIVANGHVDTYVGRLTIGGARDTTFNEPLGASSLDTGDEIDDSSLGVTLDNQGRIIVVGSTANNIFVARYNSNGTLDESFADRGLYTYLTETQAEARDVVVDPNGKIVVVGTIGHYLESQQMFVLRLK